MPKYEILLVDDDPLLLQDIGPPIEKYGYNVTVADNGISAVGILDKKYFDLIITDLVMSPLDGFQVLKKAKKMDPLTRIIILTAYGDIKFTVDALRLGAHDFLLKPCDPEEIRYRMKKCLDHLEIEMKIKIYEKILPVCCVCKKIRDDTGKEHGTGEWMSPEDYLTTKSKIDITHTYCPECAKKIQEEYEDFMEDPK